MIGRKVADWMGETGVVVDWKPLSAALCDVLVRHDDGSECWYGSGGLRATDGLGALPDRQAARARADAEALTALRAIRAGLVQEIRERKPWPGAEHGKALVGRGIDGAIAEVEARLAGRVSAADE